MDFRLFWICVFGIGDSDKIKGCPWPQAALQTENVAEKARPINAAYRDGISPEAVPKKIVTICLTATAKDGTGPQEQDYSHGIENPDGGIPCRPFFEAQFHLHILYSSNPCSTSLILHK